MIDYRKEQYQTDPYTKGKFEDLNIDAINVRKVVGDILDTVPTVGVLTDGVTNDPRDRQGL